MSEVLQLRRFKSVLLFYEYKLNEIFRRDYLLGTRSAAPFPGKLLYF